jgi:hypothetical protein
MAKLYYCEQGTPEWHALRLGIPTSSEFDKIVTPKEGKLSKSAAPYMHWLLASWIVGKPLETFESDHMQHGKEFEPEARRAFAFDTDLEVSDIGFITNDAGTIGASPDGLVGENATLELKCPQPQTHVGYMVTRALDDKYRCQVQGQLYVAEREIAYVQSYCPGLPSVIIKVGRDEKFIGELAPALDSFVEIMLRTREKLEQEYGPFVRQQQTARVEDFGPLGVSDDDVAAIWAASQEAPDARR